MTREEAIDIIKAERECVYRQGRTGECCRDDFGCGACDLVMEDVDIIEAYDMAIEALKDKRPHGEWIETDFEDEIYGFFEKCTNCGEAILSTHMRYCGNCGASMQTQNDNN